MGNDHLIPKDVRKLIAHEPTGPRGVGYDWVEKVIAVITELDRHPDLRIDKFQMHPPVSDFVKETMGDSMAFELPDAILSYYKVCDGLDLEWSYRDGAAFHPGGSIQLYGYGEVFGSWLNVLWGTTVEGADEDEVDFSWEIRAIDGGQAGDDFLTVMHTPETLPSFNLYYREPAGETFTLAVDFLEYLDAMLEARGALGWQALVAETSDRSHPTLKTKAKQATGIINRFFSSGTPRYISFEEEE